MDNNQSLKEIYREACAKIAAEILGFGYKYLKSQQKLVKKDGDLTFEIRFQTSYYNSRDYLVSIDVSTSISSKKLKLYETNAPHICLKNYPEQFLGSMFADDLHSSKKQKGITGAWNLHNVETRSDVINEIVDIIKTQISDVFSLFYDHDKVIDKVVNHQLHGLSYPKPVTSYLLCFSTPERFKEWLIKYLHRVSLANRSIYHLDDFEEAYEKLSNLSLEELNCVSTSPEPAKFLTYYMIKYEWGNLAKRIPNKRFNGTNKA